MNLIPRSAPGLSPAQQSNDILLIAGSTPASNWERILPLFERAGCTLPAPGPLEEWFAVARGNAALGQPGVTTLNPGALHQSLRSASSALLDACLPPVVLAVEELEARPEFWLEEIPGARLLMFHTRPETALIAAMEAGQPLDEALAQWAEAADGVLRIYRHYRRRVALIDVECVLAAPIDFLRACKTWLGFQPLPYSVEPAEQASVGTELHRLIAAQTVAQSPALTSLLSELEACSLPIGEPAAPPSVDCNDVYSKLRADQARRDALENERAAYLRLAEERARHIASIEKAKAENEVLLRDAIESLKEARYMLGVKNAREEQLRRLCESEAEAKARLEENVLLIQEAASRAASLREENELLLLQLRQAQVELETYRHRLSANQAELEKREKDIRNLKQAHEEQVRRLREVEAGAKARMEENAVLIREAEFRAASLGEDNELLLSQLQQAQVALESCHHRLSQTEWTLRKRELRVGALEASRSWRVTGPLRALKLFARRLLRA